MSEVSVMTDFTRRLFRTPMRDLLRLRITGRLDLKTRVRSANLPAPATMLVLRVASRTRLWRLEKADVADELVSHFADALSAGQTVAQALTDFGDERLAAKLIRRAKVRNRPLVWHLYHAVCCGVLACMAFYGLAAAFFYTGHATPTVDYIAIFNQKAQSIPEDQRAWPLYRQIDASLYDHTDPKAQERLQSLAAANPGDPAWAQLTSFLDSHQPQLAQIRQASEKSAIGIVFQSNGRSADFPSFQAGSPELPFDVPMRNANIDPSANIVSQLALLLIDDAALAAERLEGYRFVQDVRAVLAMASQLKGMGTASAVYTSIDVRRHVMPIVSYGLDEHAAALSDADLQQLAHLFADPDTAAEIVSMDSLPLVLSDYIQRMFTDDGHGSGRLTPAGLAALMLYGRSDLRVNELFQSGPVRPVFMLAGPSRQATETAVRAAIEVENRRLGQPLREIDPKYWSRQEEAAVKSGAIKYVTQLPLLVMDPAGNLHAVAERYLGERDGLLVGLAMELYRRHHGTYPEKLRDLVPTYLPSLPVDRITGGELHSRIINGKPLIYSLGDDRDDDGGALPRDASKADYQYPGTVRNIVAFGSPRSGPRDGDWVLYPIPLPAGAGR